MRSLPLAALLLVLACGDEDPATGVDSGVPVDGGAADDGSPPDPIDAEPSADASSPEPIDAAADAVAEDAAPGDASPMTDAGLTEGCGLEPSGASLELMHDGLTRTALVHVPASYNRTTPTPLVLAFHGYGQSSAEIESFSRLAATADREGFIVVFPEGTGIIGSWNAGACCGTAAVTGVDDVGFVSSLLDALEARLCVDTRRVYATGMSNGGFLTHRLACELSERIAAIAPVAGVLGVARCEPTRPVPVFQMHGTADAVVPYLGNGFSYPSVRSTMADWVERDGCEAEPSTVLDQDDVRCDAWQGCDEGVEVKLCTIELGGHTWPGGEPLPLLGRTTDTISASDEMWDFFARYALP